LASSGYSSQPKLTAYAILLTLDLPKFKKYVDVGFPSPCVVKKVFQT